MAYRECVDCEHCKTLEDSDGDIIHFCMDVNGGNYLAVTGLCGFCGEDDEQEGTDYA